MELIVRIKRENGIYPKIGPLGYLPRQRKIVGEFFALGYLLRLQGGTQAERKQSEREQGGVKGEQNEAKGVVHFTKWNGVRVEDRFRLVGES
ncbi:MAG: hypothetical protein ABI254_15550 [Chthoniobacterales bacterium]